MKKKADMGIGTLILFIAMILVAAIAAGVLIQTATSLQNKALLTGERSKSQVSTSLRPVVIYAQDGSDGFVEELYINLNLAPGSDPIRLSDLLIEFALKNLSSDLVYDDVGNCSDLSSANLSNFYVEYLIDGENKAEGYLQRGDVIKICFKSGRPIYEDESVSLALVPKVGNPTILHMAMPDIMTEERVNIFP